MALGVVCVVVLGFAQLASAADGQTALRLLDTILDAGPRFVGLEGHARTAQTIEQHLRGLSAGRVISHDTLQVAPVVSEAHLHLPDGRAVKVYPLWPNGARLCTTPAEGIEGALVHIGSGHERDIPATRLKGAVVTMDYNSYDRWKLAFELGARAVLFLPPTDTTWVHSHGKFADIAFNAPRFYVDDGESARALLDLKNGQTVRVVSRMAWEARPVRSLIWTLPGSDPGLADQVVIFTARYDAAGVVPQLAHGAEQAISAAALCELASDLARDPPKRTVVLIFGGADTFNHASLRAVLGTALLDETAADTLETQLATLRALNDDIERDMTRTLVDQAAARGRFDAQIKQNIVALRKQLRTLRSTPSHSDASKHRLHARLEEESHFHRVQIAIQRNRIDDTHTPHLEDLRGPVLERLNAEIAETERRLATRRVEVEQIRPLVDRDRVVAVLAVDITSQAPAFGVYWQTHWTAPDWKSEGLFAPLSRLGQRLVGRRKSGQTNEDLTKGIVSDTFAGRRDWHSDIPCPLGTATDTALHFGYLSLAFVTAHDGRWLVDSPLDRRQRLNMANVADQIPALSAMARKAANDTHFRLTNRLGTSVSTISGQAVVPSPGDTRLNLGQPGRLVTVNTVRPTPRAVGTRWLSVQHTSATGTYRFEHVSHSAAAGALYVVDVMGLDSVGRIVEAANQAEGLQSYLFRSALRVNRKIEGIKSVLFDCAQENIAGLRDPRYVQTLREVRPMLYRAGRRAARSVSIDPRYLAVRAADGLATVAVPPHERWLTVISRGQRGVRMLMTGADRDHPLGTGLPAAERDTPVRSALAYSTGDFFHLNQMRLDDLARYGINSALTDALQKKTSQHLDDADAAWRSDRAAEALHHRRAALALQQVVYHHALRTGDDVVLAVIFLLIVLMPFSFYLERLLVNAATIYGRIAGFTVVFLLMMGLLYSFHPAFAISMTPIVVLLAFVIIVLSATVIFILYGRFVEQVKQGLSGEHTTSLSRLNVVSRAMVVGVANMRRRKIRTAFTLATLVVMTFALLSLSGTRTQMAERRIGLGIEPTFPGAMVTHVGWEKLPPWLEEQLLSDHGDRADVGGQYWLIEEAESSFAQHVVVQNDDPKERRTHLLRAVMGVGPHEHRFLAADEQTQAMLQRLAETPDGCLLPSSATVSLGVSNGDAVRIGARPFTVVGVYDESAMEPLTYLNGQSYGPIDLKSERQGLQRRAVEPQTEEQMLELSHLQTDRLLKPLPPRAFAIVGADAARAMGAALRSVCFRAEDPAVLDQLAADLSEQRLLPVYHARGDDVQLIASRASLSIVGLGDLFIPLIIGALIIINTMLNAVADQRPTIHVYTSLGLAPMHVGVLFLSEAAALGTLGAVGGFILGQGFATLMRAAGMLDALTLNFSSTAVILTMVLVMAIVLVSAIYPALMAGRLAAPAESMRWQLPAPDGDLMAMELPFTVSELTARGSPPFLHQWLSLHTEAGVGGFISDQTALYESRDARGVKTRVWLAPFDVGVSQDVHIEMAPTQDSGSDTQRGRFYQIVVRMQRRAGQPTAWRRSARGFIAELRKQFLLWRALSAERQEVYARQWREISP